MGSDDRELEAMAARLEESGRYRLLRLIERPAIVERVVREDARTAVILDVETTGLDSVEDEIVELAMLKFQYSLDGTLLGVCGLYEALREPTKPLPSDVAKLTGLSDAMLKDRRIDAAAVEAFVADADLVLAHGSAFDRRFCERQWPFFQFKPWGCSVTEIDWRGAGFSAAKLPFLLSESGLFHRAHRALDDCVALHHLLARPLGGTGDTAFAALLGRSRATTVRIWASDAPFELKHLLKKRGYRWSDGSDGSPKAWYVELTEDRVDAELRYLADEIYQRPFDPGISRLTAWERYSSRA